MTNPPSSSYGRVSIGSAVKTPVAKKSSPKLEDDLISVLISHWVTPPDFPNSFLEEQGGAAMYVGLTAFAKKIEGITHGIRVWSSLLDVPM